MKQSKVGVACCAAIVGMTIGIGSTLYAKDIALSAYSGDVVSNVRRNDEPLLLSIRRLKSTNTMKKQDSHGGTINHLEFVTNKCTIQKQFATDLTDEILNVIPLNGHTQIIRHDVAAVLEQYSLAECQ